jgi:hypothetical protein
MPAEPVGRNSETYCATPRVLKLRYPPRQLVPCGLILRTGCITRHERFGCSIIGIYKDNVGWLPSWRIDRQEYDRMFEELRHGMDGSAFKEKQLTGFELGFCRSVLCPKRTASRKDIEKLVAGRVIMRRRGPIDAKHPGAGVLSIGQVLVDKQCRGCFWKGIGYRSDVKASGRRGGHQASDPWSFRIWD